MRSLLEKDGEILMYMLHAVVLDEGDRTVTSLAISPPILSIPVSLFSYWNSIQQPRLCSLLCKMLLKKGG